MREDERNSVDMNIRDYKSEGAALKQGLCLLVAKRTTGAIAKGVLRIPELLLGRTLSARQAVVSAVSEWDRMFDEVRGQFDVVSAEGAAVEASEGFLYQCAKCGAPSRSHFGGKPDDQAIHLVGTGDPLAVPDWLCGKCFGAVTRRAADIAMWYGSFVGVVTSGQIPGYRIMADKGRLCSQAEFQSPDELKEHMRLVAARAGANACINFLKELHEESVLVGHSKNGNPFYRTARSFSATARAVVVEADRLEYAHRRGCRP